MLQIWVIFAWNRQVTVGGDGSVGWCCSIHRRHPRRRVKLHKRVPWIYDTKQYDGEVSVMLELWGMRNNTLLLSLPGPLWPGVVAPDGVLSMGQIELNGVPMLDFIIIMSRRQRGYLWPSLAISPYHSSPPAGLRGYILCPHIVVRLNCLK